MSHLKIHNVGKAYKRYHGKWARLAEWITGRERHEKHWVLRDISFDVAPGEAVGIIGVNGAGKSTLLKIITGTTQPTIGSVKVGGSVAALLELGMGFHPDFTGRQNAYMSGQILGLSSEWLSDLMPQIESFAEIGDYIDQPTRTYSSGMQMRLAFAVATAVRPNILIVDEALSVGDAAFQRKCFRRIESFLEAGTTLLFVSHDMETIKKLCSRALFIKEGNIGCYDAAKIVCDEYEKYLFSGSCNEIKKPSRVHHATQFDPALVASSASIYGNGKAIITACWIENSDGHMINIAESGQQFVWCFDVIFQDDVVNPVFNMQVKTCEGIVLYGINSGYLGYKLKNMKSGETIEARFKMDGHLAPGTYFLNCGVKEVAQDTEEFLHRHVDAAIIRIISSMPSTVARGLVDLGARFKYITKMIADRQP